MNKDMKLKKGDTIYYKYNTFIKREEHTNEMLICSFAGKTINYFCVECGKI